MPNWTYNRIKCKKEIGDKLLTIKDDIYSLDFNKLIPMPEDLKLDAGSIESDSISCYYLSLNDDEKYKLMKLLKSKEASYCHNYWNKYKDDIKKLENNPKRLNEKINAYSKESNERMLNTIQKVLITGVSEKDPNKVCGYTENMKLVNVEADKNTIGQIIDVKITEAKSFSLDGIISK